MRVYKKMRRVGLILWFTGCVRLYKDGDGFNAVFRAWHPLTWLMLVLMIIPCAIVGEQLSYVVPLRISKFWNDNASQLQWVTPFTQLSELESFRSSL